MLGSCKRLTASRYKYLGREICARPYAPAIVFFQCRDCISQIVDNEKLCKSPKVHLLAILLKDKLIKKECYSIQTNSTVIYPANISDIQTATGTRFSVSPLHQKAPQESRRRFDVLRHSVQSSEFRHFSRISCKKRFNIT